MTKREEIDQLKNDLSILACRVETLQRQIVSMLSEVAKSKQDNSLKSYKQIQADWFARHGDLVKCPPEKKPPKPYAHPCAED